MFYPTETTRKSWPSRRAAAAAREIVVSFFRKMSGKHRSHALSLSSSPRPALLALAAAFRAAAHSLGASLLTHLAQVAHEPGRRPATLRALHLRLLAAAAARRVEYQPELGEEDLVLVSLEEDVLRRAYRWQDIVSAQRSVRT